MSIDLSTLKAGDMIKIVLDDSDIKHIGEDIGIMAFKNQIIEIIPAEVKPTTLKRLEAVKIRLMDSTSPAAELIDILLDAEKEKMK